MNGANEDESRKAAALAAMAENFGRELSAALLSLWLDLLKPWGADAVAAAARLVIERYEYKTMPPFAVLKNALDELAGAGEKERRNDAVRAWEGVLAAIGRVGPYGEPDLPPRAARVLRLMGGWDEACCWERAALDFKRRDFLALWADTETPGMQALDAPGRPALAPGVREAAKALFQ